MHRRAAQFLGSRLLPDGRLHQRRPGQKQSRPFGHQHRIRHHRKIRAPRNAHAHDRRDLRNSQRTHHRVVAEDAPEIIGIRKHILLQRQKNARTNRPDRAWGCGFPSAIVCARSTFFAVIGKNAPAFTVASLATIMHRRPLTLPSPVTTPAPGAPPYSAYIPCAAHSPSSINSVSSSSSRLSRSLTVSRPLRVLRFRRLCAAAQPNRVFFAAQSQPCSASNALRLATARVDAKSVVECNAEHLFSTFNSSVISSPVGCARGLRRQRAVRSSYS